MHYILISFKATGLTKEKYKRKYTRKYVRAAPEEASSLTCLKQAKSKKYEPVQLGIYFYI